MIMPVEGLAGALTEAQVTLFFTLFHDGGSFVTFLDIRDSDHAEDFIYEEI
jgi:hypothetical protein